MTRMTFAFRHQKGLHQLFLISVWIKGLSGILETLAGIVAVFVEPRALESVVLFLTATELSEDPDDWFATFLGGAVRQYSADTQTFLSVYLISHGLIRVFLVAGMLRRKLWAYPASLVALGLFIVYQGERFMHTHSIWLVFLTIVDLGVAYLIWDEYQLRKRG